MRIRLIQLHKIITTGPFFPTSWDLSRTCLWDDPAFISGMKAFSGHARSPMCIQLTFLWWIQVRSSEDVEVLVVWVKGGDTFSGEKELKVYFSRLT